MAGATCVAEGTGGTWHMMIFGIIAMLVHILVGNIGDVDEITYRMIFDFWMVLAICGAIRRAR